jgi:hypothetical protein
MSNSDERWFVLPINPEPWAVGPLGVNHKTKRAYMGENQKLAAYQNAVREQVEDAIPTVGEVEITLYIWRALEKATTFDGKKRRAHTSDATNIQKATEDAIQGFLIENDRNVRKVMTEIVEQSERTTPCIVIRVKPYEEHDPSTIPDAVWAGVDKVQGLEQQGQLPFETVEQKMLDNTEDIF